MSWIEKVIECVENVGEKIIEALRALKELI